MKIEITCPDNKNEIKLSQYQKFIKAIKDLDNDFLMRQYMVEIFCDLPNSVVRNMSKKSFNDVVNHLNVLLGEEDYKFIDRFTMNGIEYGFIPNLEDIKVGEMADIDSYIGDWQKMDKAMGVLFRPVTHTKKDKYIIEDYKNSVSLDLPLDVCLGAYFFLKSLLRDLLPFIPKYIKEEVHQNPKLQSLVLNGDGINQFTESLEEVFSSLNVSMS